ncbi:nucleotidyltransferase family protein [Methylorubrum extorquens]
MTGSEPRIGAVILAAGLGSRFGQAAKMLAPYAGRPMVRRAAEAALASRAGPVVAVLGAHAAAVRDALAGLDLRLVENPDPAAGLSASLRLGLAALPPETEAAVVLLGDMPRIGPEHIDALIAAYTGATPRPSAVVPVSDGRRGNPVLLDLARLGADLAMLTGDHGAGPILKRRGDVLELPADPAVIFDVDTPEALEG